MATLLVSLGLAVQPVPAQNEFVQMLDENTWVEERPNPMFHPLTEAEKLQALSVLQSGLGKFMPLAGTQRVQTVCVERHDEDKHAPPDKRRADIVLYNYDTNETVSAVVTLGLSPLVEELKVVADQPLRLGPEEVEEAHRLALAHPAVQAKLRAAGLKGRESELMITHIRFEADTEADPCSADRCVTLSFNTRDAVLDIQPIVNLTTGEVNLQ